MDTGRLEQIGNYYRVNLPKVILAIQPFIVKTISKTALTYSTSTLVKFTAELTFKNKLVHQTFKRIMQIGKVD